MSDRLMPGQLLSPGKSLLSLDGRFELILQSDDNLVLYWRGVGPLWATGTSGKRAHSAIMQGDGNFVLYGQAGALWHTSTHGKPGAWLIVQNDGNMVIYGSGGALWNSRTRIPDQALQVGNFVVDNQSDHPIYVKPEGSGSSVAVRPGGSYAGRHDGVAAPHLRQGEVYKTYDHVGVTVTDANIQTHVPVFRHFSTFQNVTGGTWLQAKPDPGWDAVFQSSGTGSSDRTPSPGDREPGGDRDPGHEGPPDRIPIPGGPSIPWLTPPGVDIEDLLKPAPEMRSGEVGRYQLHHVSSDGGAVDCIYVIDTQKGTVWCSFIGATEMTRVTPHGISGEHGITKP